METITQKPASLWHAGKQQKQERPFLKKVGGQNQLPKMSSDLYTHHVAQEQTHKHNFKKRQKNRKEESGARLRGGRPWVQSPARQCGDTGKQGKFSAVFKQLPQFLNGRPARGSLTTCVEH